MVSGGVLPARSAEEVAKLPRGSQLHFAEKAVQAALPKDRIAKLVAMHNDQDTHDAMRIMILESPADVPFSRPRRGRTLASGRGGLQKVESLLRFVAKASAEAAKEIEKLNWSEDSDRLPNRKLVEKLRAEAARLAAVARNALATQTGGLRWPEARFPGEKESAYENRLGYVQENQGVETG